MFAYDVPVWNATDRALQLTELCLQHNPANYTVWHFRRLCLEAIGLTDERVQTDLELAARFGGMNPKNYQIWYHRRALLNSKGLTIDSARKELDYIASVLEIDGKNYHSWSHRQWILTTVNDDTIWADELVFGTCTCRIEKRIARRRERERERDSACDGTIVCFVFGAIAVCTNNDNRSMRLVGHRLFLHLYPGNPSPLLLLLLQLKRW